MALSCRRAQQNLPTTLRPRRANRQNSNEHGGVKRLDSIQHRAPGYPSGKLGQARRWQHWYFGVAPRHEFGGGQVHAVATGAIRGSPGQRVMCRFSLYDAQCGTPMCCRRKATCYSDRRREISQSLQCPSMSDRVRHFFAKNGHDCLRGILFIKRLSRAGPWGPQMWIMAGFDRGLLTVCRRSSAALASETRVERPCVWTTAVARSRPAFGLLCSGDWFRSRRVWT